MDDPTGLGRLAEGAAKLADAKLPNKMYDDAASGAMKEVGGTLSDIAKTGRYVVQRLLALGVTRFHEYMVRIESRVAPENRIEADPAIAGPVLEKLSYLEPENPLAELYLNLLRRAIDKTRQGEAHPAFANIIAQLSPDEALVLYLLKNRGRQPAPRGREGEMWAGDFPHYMLSNKQHFSTYISHLKSLDLVVAEPRDLLLQAGRPLGFGQLMTATTVYLDLSDFGKMFATACIPDDFPCPPDPFDSPAVENSCNG